MQIFPALGIARVGDSASSFYVGPEAAGALPTELEGSPVQQFRDEEGALRRQAARFRLFDGETEVVVGSAVGGRRVVDIRWTAWLANKKPIFWAFQELSGEQGYGPDHPLRNPQVTDPGERQQRLIVDPGPATVGQGQPQASFARRPEGPYPQTFPPPLRPVSIDTLGELRVDELGRLLVLGGYGRSGTQDPGDLALPHYANNDGWFDDVSDGPVDAVVVYEDGTTEAAEGAWVVVAPPAYAPQVVNQVTLYDLIFDTCVRNLAGFRDDLCQDGVFNEAYAPSFPDEILPLLQRAQALSFVATREQGTADGERVNTYTSRVLAAPHDFGTLNAASGLQARFLLSVLRQDPNAPFAVQSVTPAMPFLAGDNPLTNDQVSKFALMTETQRFLLSQWALGKATDAPLPAPAPGDALTRGVLENAVGAPLCPGIEGGWMFRNPALYAAPFRIARAPVSPGGLVPQAVVGPAQPGDLTCRMAQPWQADFNECSVQAISTKDPSLNVGADGEAPLPTFLALWWPGQRPMSIYTRSGRRSAADWARDSAGNTLTNLEMAENWSKLGFVIDQGSPGAPDLVEVQRSPKLFGRPAEAPVSPEPASASAPAVFGQLVGVPASQAHDLASQLATLAASDPSAVQQAAVDFFTEGAALSPAETHQCKLVSDQLKNRYAADKDDIAQPRTVAELVDQVSAAVKLGRTVKVVGSARSLSDAPEPGDDALLVSTCGFADPLPIDASSLKDPSRAAMLYRCGAGRTVKEILAELDPNPSDPTAPMPRTFANLGAGQFQAVMGAIGTSTHGSGMTKPSFPQMVVAMEVLVVQADGTVALQRVEPTDGVTDPSRYSPTGEGHDLPVALVQDDATFQALVVSMGTMGVVYAVTLQLVAGFYLQEQREVTTWQAVKPQLDQLLADNDYFELVLDPLTSVDEAGQVVNLCLTSKRNVVPAYTDCGSRPLLMKVGTTELGRISSAVLLEWALKNPPKRVPFNLSTGVQGSAVACYTDKSYHVLQLNMDVNAASTEQNVPVEQAAQAIDAVLGLVQSNYDSFSQRFPPGKGNDFDPDTPFHEDPAALQRAWRELPICTSPLGIRFVPPNEAPMSPMYQRGTCTIEVPMPGSDFLDARASADGRNPSQLVQLYTAYLDGRRKLFRDIERLLQQQFVARPHWGQANFLDNTELRAVFPGFEDWSAVYQRYNATGTFNAAITRRLGISVYPHADILDLPQGPVTGEAIFRHQRSKNRGILKIKDDLGWTLYNGLTAPVDTTCEWLFPKKCKRMGVSYVASTQNLVDPVVAEFRFSPEGELVSRVEDFQLYHSLSSNRQYGQATFDGSLLTVTGDAATGLRAFVNANRRVGAEAAVAPDGPVVLRLIDFATGKWELEPL